MKNTFALLIGAFMICSAAAARQPVSTRVIAHRGHWKTDLSAQNSIASLKHACRIGAYGTEFDVLLTLDDVPVVVHGPKHRGDTVERTLFADLRNQLLENEEPLPTLEEYLRAGALCPQMRLILEIKSHVTPERETLAVTKVVKMVQSMGLCKQVDYIAFSQHVVNELLRLAPTAEIAYLNGDLSPAALKDRGATGLDYHYTVLRKFPHWVAEARQLGLSTNVWTVDDPTVMQEMIDLGVDFITTNEPEVLQQLIHSLNNEIDE